MRKILFIGAIFAAGASLLSSAGPGGEPKAPRRIGQEISVPHHLADDDEFKLPLSVLLQHGELLFKANWTEQAGTR